MKKIEIFFKNIDWFDHWTFAAIYLFIFHLLYLTPSPQTADEKFD